MEKIKQALDRARNERGGSSVINAGSYEDDYLVKYAATQSIKGSMKKMQDSRISTALGQ